MFCSKCGKEIEENATFCPYCGGNVKNEDNHDKVLTKKTTEIKTTNNIFIIIALILSSILSLSPFVYMFSVHNSSTVVTNISSMKSLSFIFDIISLMNRFHVSFSDAVTMAIESNDIDAVRLLLLSILTFVIFIIGFICLIIAFVNYYKKNDCYEKNFWKRVSNLSLCYLFANFVEALVLNMIYDFEDCFSFSRYLEPNLLFGVFEILAIVLFAFSIIFSIIIKKQNNKVNK